MMMIRKTIPNAEDSIEILDSELHAMGVIDRKCLPIVSPYNTHCIPSPQAFQRIVEILIDEVQIGRRIPLNFRCLEVLIKKMERIFVGKHIFKTMVDRNMVHELINEATELMEKFNGKLKKPKGLLGEITPDLSEQQKIEAFLDAYDQVILYCFEKLRFFSFKTTEPGFDATVSFGYTVAPHGYCLLCFHCLFSYFFPNCCK